MIFADKLIRLRKRMGLSQEELADKMNVSRQAVSKWESGQSVPDLGRILELSTLFNVSTDYLLKDEIEIEESVGDDSLVRVLTLDEVNEYLKSSENSMLKLATATLFCVLSPVLLIVLSILSDESLNFISSELAVVIGLSCLFLFVIIGVIIFITNDFSQTKYKQILKEDFSTEYGVSGIVKEKREKFRSAYNKTNLTGIIMCIVSPIALIISSFTNNLYAVALSLALLFILVAISVFMFVYVDTKWSSYQIILHEDKKKETRKSDKISSVIWLSAVALFLTISFTFSCWELSWIVFVVAAFIQVIVSILINKEE